MNKKVSYTYQYLSRTETREKCLGACLICHPSPFKFRLQVVQLALFFIEFSHMGLGRFAEVIKSFNIPNIVFFRTVRSSLP